MSKISITECPRDAMQGIKQFIPTSEKVQYLNTLLEVGFDVLDFGSFVSPKAIPQMQDTAEVLGQLNLNTETKLLAIIANERGAEEAVRHQAITYLGFPFSVSETFQKRNTNSTIKESLQRVKTISEMCDAEKKQLVVYLSMAFGNPYGDDWDESIVLEHARALAEETGVTILSLADTIGIANPSIISRLFARVVPSLPQVTFTAHFHTTPDTWKEKVQAAYSAGCRSFDGAIKGYGGCPMAKDELTGNMPTEKLLGFCRENHISTGVSEEKFQEAFAAADGIFSKYH